VIVQQFVPVVCGIIEQNGEVLSAKRNSLQTNAGLWEFPGGKVHPGELPIDALKRELLEELGVEVSTSRQLQPVFYEYPWISIELIPFICKIIGGNLVAHEHEELRLIRMDDVRQLNWAPADLLVIECYLSDK
jgi:8-oxo-dGTP diphosphatase